MKLYLLQREGSGGYDTYNSAVVAARSPREARFIHPDGNAPPNWWETVDLFGPLDTWVRPADVKVFLIGYARPSQTKPGVILSSFRAG